MWSCEWKRMKLEDLDVGEFVSELNLRKAAEPHEFFSGGRCNAGTLKYHCQPGEKIHHLDISSLYPTVNKKDPYPLYHPEIITSNFRDVKEYFGFVKCKVLCPDQDHFPILPMKIEGKLVFPLCHKCAVQKTQTFCTHNDRQRAFEGTWCTPELHLAVEQGYKIIEIYEVWHWAKTKTGMFADYINKFLKEKMEASDWPTWCKSEEDKEKYVKQVFEAEGIKLDPARVENNPGRRAVAKLMLNSFWGKYGMRDSFHQTEFVYEPKKFFELVFSKNKIIHDMQIVSEECAMVTYSTAEEFLE
jgi:hypothetical protein